MVPKWGKNRKMNNKQINCKRKMNKLADLYFYLKQWGLCSSMSQVLQPWPPDSSKKQTLCKLLSSWMRASRLPWMSRKRQVSLYVTRETCYSVDWWLGRKSMSNAQHVVRTLTLLLKEMWEAKRPCCENWRPNHCLSPFVCLHQQNLQTSRSSSFRTQKPSLALPNCDTALRLLPGPSLCQASMIIKSVKMESGAEDQVVDRWLNKKYVRRGGDVTWLVPVNWDKSWVPFFSTQIWETTFWYLFTFSSQSILVRTGPPYWGKRTIKYNKIFL